MWECQNCETFNEGDSCNVCGMEKLVSDRLFTQKMAAYAAESKRRAVVVAKERAEYSEGIEWSRILGWFAILLAMLLIIYFANQ